jgi:hypothetical protein
LACEGHRYSSVTCTLYRGGRARAVNRFTSSNAATIIEIKRSIKVPCLLPDAGCDSGSSRSSTAPRRMQGEPAVRHRKATRPPASVFVAVSLGNRVLFDRIKFARCSVDHRGGDAFCAGNLGKEHVDVRHASQVWSTRSPQPFGKPKCPNCSEAENENPSARKES